MTIPLMTVALENEEDVVIMRQRAYQIARLLTYEGTETTRIATAVSEIARNAFEYGKEGRGEFIFDDSSEPQALIILIKDKGTGIQDLQKILDGQYVSKSGMGVGITGTRKLMDKFHIETNADGTCVTLSKQLPRFARRLSRQQILRITEQLANETPKSPIQDMRRQNQEILSALQELERRQIEMERLNQELAETNRGVVALYAELDTRAEEAQRADEIKTKFLSHVSHEFRTPVNCALSLSDFLLQKIDGPLNAEQEKQVGLIRASMEDLADLINDLLDLAKVEAGKVTFRIEEFDINECLHSLRGMLRPLLTNPNVQLNFNEFPEPVKLTQDLGKLSQILRNFISNAIKFTEQGEITVRPTHGRDHGFITIEVEDTGVGIALADQKRIFQEFSQIDSALQKRHRGTGLGLAVSKKLAELLGGFVEVRSTQGKGSIFSVSLPMHFIDKSDDAFNARTSLDIPAYEVVPRVLLIDDDVTTCYTLKRALELIECELTEASDGLSGVKCARDILPDIIFLDLRMPNMDGIEVLEKLREYPELKAIPVVLHTSQNLSASDQAKLKNHQVCDIISKSMGFNEALASVRRLVSRPALEEGVVA